MMVKKMWRMFLTQRQIIRTDDCFLVGFLSTILISTVSTNLLVFIIVVVIIR
jgi:hypothetical protein